MRPDIRLEQINSTFVFVVPRDEDRDEKGMNELIDRVTAGINVSDKPLDIPYEDLEVFFRERSDEEDYMIVQGVMLIPQVLDS